MDEVENTPLCKDHTFPDKNTLLLRIAEETNLGGVRSHIVKSDPITLHVQGYKFVVRANFSSSKGWHCSRAQCRKGDFVSSDNDMKFTNKDDEQYFDCEGDDREEEQAERDVDDDDDDNDGGDDTGTGKK